MSTAEIAILISLLSVVLAAISLGWQVVAFQRSGYKIKCALELGYIQNARLESGSPITTTMMSTPKRWAQVAALRERKDQQFFMTVINSGRAAVWIDSIGLTTKHGVVEATTGSSAPGLPYRLDSHQTQRWSIPMTHAAQLVLDIAEPETSCTHGSVTLGDGRTLTTKEGVSLALLRDVIARQ